MGSKTNYARNATLNGFLRNTPYTPAATVYLAMFTADPTATGSLTDEVTGGSYVRKAIAFDAPSPAGQTQNTSLVSFDQASADWSSGADVTHWGVMDASTSGNMIYFGSWGTHDAVLNGQTAKVAAGQVEIDEV